MRPSRIPNLGFFLLAAVVGSASGCQAVQLENRTVRMSATLSDLQYKQVMDNLAATVENPSAMPFFAVAQTGHTTIQQNAQGSAGVQWALAAIGRLLFNQVNLGVQYNQQNIEEWDTAPSLDPVQIILMQGLYRKAVGCELSQHQACALQDFFHAKPDKEQEDCCKTEKKQDQIVVVDAQGRRTGTYPLPKGETAPLNVVGLGNGTVAYINKKASKTGSVTGATNEQPIVITSKAHGLSTGNHVEICGLTGNQAALGIWTITVKDADTFSLNGSDGRVPGAVPGNTKYVSGGTWVEQSGPNMHLYGGTASSTGHGPYPTAYQAVLKDVYNAIGPGWLHTGCVKDCPKNARFVGRHGKTCVWVTQDGIEGLTNLTIAILDVSTADLSKMSGQTGAASAGGTPSISSPRIRSFIAPQQIAPTP